MSYPGNPPNMDSSPPYIPGNPPTSPYIDPASIKQPPFFYNRAHPPARPDPGKKWSWFGNPHYPLSAKETMQIEKEIEKSKVLAGAIFSGIAFTGLQLMRLYFMTWRKNQELISTLEKKGKPIMYVFFFNTLIFYLSFLGWMILLISFRSYYYSHGKHLPEHRLFISVTKGVLIITGGISLIGYLAWFFHYRKVLSNENPSIDIDTLYDTITPVNLFVIVLIGSMYIDGLMGEEFDKMLEESEENTTTDKNIHLKKASVLPSQALL